jgi:hypothetical protein
MLDIGRWIVAAIEHVIRSAQNTAASAATFARNDLLFTMSDNTRDAMAPLEGHGRIHAISCFTDEKEADWRHRWWSQTDSNRRPPACKAGALPTELWPQVGGRPPSPRLQRATFAVRRLVGLGRFELPTSRLSSARSNQLSYRPKKHTLDPRCRKGRRAMDAPTTLDSVGSSEKKEKRRRRSPANGHANPETDMPRCFQEIR